MRIAAALLTSPVLLVTLLAALPATTKDQCTEPADVAYFDDTLTFDAAGKGRLHFHAAPHASCVDKKLFVIPGDTLMANKTAGSGDVWVEVTYTDKDEHSHTGWVRAERLRFRGASGMNMTPAKFKHYTTAAAAAKAGKLGLP